MVDKALHSSNTDEWETPQHLFDFLNNDIPEPFTLDPCATPENAKCKNYYTIEDDGLRKSWSGIVFVNPPYSSVDKWLAKAVYECRSTNEPITIALLIGSRTDTTYWRDYIWTGPVWALTFIRGRLKFGNATNSAPFPSCIVWMSSGVNTEGNMLIRPIVEVLDHDKKWNWYYL
ncbi:MAG: phage N-6-adenine-methyltransferase [Clostridia bacterium]|nr:phage N-6-adenine-methyltransferase [Clostridia bacterium]